MTKRERELMSKVYAKLSVLGGILDPTEPEGSFPNGRLNAAHKLASEAYNNVVKILLPVWKKENKK